MRIRIRGELLLINTLVILLIIAIAFFPSNVMRVILGLPFVLFLPGYVLMAALFPRKEGIGGIERVALSFGVSIAVVPLIGFILNYGPWGIKLESILYSMASFILITSVIAWFRRKGLPGEERFGIEFHLRVPIWRIGIRNKVLFVTLTLVILGALGTLGYVIAIPKVEQKFTEFYVLGLNGKAIQYPKKLIVGEEEKVVLGIVNHEYETVSYRLEVRINGVKCNEVGPVVLGNDEKREQEVSFVPQVAGDKQEVEFLLYKNGEAKPYLEPLCLWVAVME